MVHLLSTTTQSSHQSGGVLIYPGISVSSISIRMEFLQYPWLYVIALYPMHGIYLSDSGYIGTSDIGSILDHL